VYVLFRTRLRRAAVAAVVTVLLAVLAYAQPASDSDAPLDAGAGLVVGVDASVGTVVGADAPDNAADLAADDARSRPRVRPDAAVADASPGDAGAAASGPLTEDAGIDDDAGIEAALDEDAGLPGAIEIESQVPSLPEPRPLVEMPTEEEMAEAIEQRRADAPVLEATEKGAPGSAESTWFTLKLIFGLAVLLALAYLGGHSRVLRLQEAIGIRGVVLAGFPFVAIGVIASLPSVGILTDEVIPKLRPVLQFGLGWIGFIVGAHLDIRVLDRLPRGSAYLILIEALLPFGVTAIGCGAVMIGVFGLSAQDTAAWRDIVLLGAAAAMTAPRRFRGLANRTWHEGKGADVLLGQLDEIAGVIGLLFITAYFRGDAAGSAWHLPGTAWLLVAVGLGVVIGVLIFATIRMPRSNAEFLAIVLGVVAFAAGLASVLRLSSVVTCFIAGTLITNFPNDQRDSVFRILTRLERPIHLLFLMIAGALWNVFDWRGWVLVPLFVLCRIAGKWLGIKTTRFTLGSVLPIDFTERRSLILPMSTMAIALVVSIERFRDAGLPWVVTAVIGGSIVFEALVPFGRGSSDDEPEEHGGPAPIDELDDSRGPVYDREPGGPSRRGEPS
jgi:Kef-type K+ transport system membrane component KefB